MSDMDDLDDFDAELELALKREYATVFALFAYCVITPEATYLCNHLRIDAAPSSGMLLFELRMEDVWVWDRNRPTRIIPRAQVYTTGDITVEQLKETPVAEFESTLPPSLVAQLREGSFEEELEQLAGRTDAANPVEPGAAPEAADAVTPPAAPPAAED